MNPLQKIYEKDNISVIVNDKFIYHSEVYKLWKGGASLLEEKYYSSDKPIRLKKSDIKVKKKDYILYRFFNLEYAPEEYLINNNYKILENYEGNIC